MLPPVCAIPSTMSATTKLVADAESHVERAANQKRYADRSLHALLAFAGNPARDNRPNRRADAARGKKYADPGSRAFANRKNLFAKNRQQRQDSATQSPRRFHQQQCQHARPALYVARAFDRFGYSERPADT